jgi:DNA modification methylase
VSLIRADARQIPLRDGCVQCVVTSPPYFGLRTYPDTRAIGAEETPETYLVELLMVFAEVWRVLREDGTVWINISDSYANDGKWGGETGGKQAYLEDQDRKRVGREKRRTGLKPKDLIGIPWMLAFALRAAGWWLRSEIIWEKPSCLPESVTDRPTRAHEHLFLVAKAESYYYDADAIKEPASLDTHARYARGRGASHKYSDGGPGDQTITRSLERMAASHPIQPGVNPKALLGEHGNRQNASFSAAVKDIVEDRNKRTIWRVNHPGFSGAHFATFPEKLIEPCILAGCPLGGLVLDPFIGSGTVGAVAERLGRRWVGTDLSYHALARERTAQRGLLTATGQG